MSKEHVMFQAGKQHAVALSVHVLIMQQWSSSTGDQMTCCEGILCLAQKQGSRV